MTNLRTIPLQTLLSAIRQGRAGAREELTRRANAAMAGHDARMEAIDSRYAERRADVIRRYGRTDLQPGSAGYL